MWAVAFFLLVVVVVAVVVALMRRPRGEDVHSVRNYNHALGTLEHLSERIGPPTVRPIPRRVTAEGSAGLTERVVPPVPVRGTDEFPDPDEPIVFDDARPFARSRTDASADIVTTPRSDRAQRMALDSMNHRRRPGTGIALAIGVVVVFGLLAFLGSHSSHKASTSSSTSTTMANSTGKSSTSTTRPTPTSKPTPSTRPTPTTLPTQYVATTTSSSGTSADYTVPNNSFQITATGTGSCWVEVDSVATGKAVWAGALTSGTVQTIQATGATSVQFGTPTLSLEIDTVPVVLPSPLRTPFVATFTPSAAAIAAAPATTTTLPSGSSTAAGGSTTTTAVAAAANGSSPTTTAAG